MHSVNADSSRQASIGLVALLLLSTLVAMTPTVSALTGNESVTGTVVDTVSGTVTASNLDANDDYRWLVFIYWPSGSLMDSDGGYVVNQGVTSFTEDANWTTAHRAGNYSVSFRLYQYPSSTLLDMYNTTFYSPGVANLTTLDQYEPNNGQTVTTPILVNSTTSNANLNSSSDYDWYEYNVTSTGEVFVNVTFDHEEVNLLLNCRRKTGSSSSTVVDSSHSDTDDESCRFNATTTGIYYLEMTSVGGAGWYNFTLEMDVPPPPASSVPDAYEPNQNRSQAATVSVPFSANQLTIHNSSDDDYFAFLGRAGDTYWVNTTFVDSQGDLDLRLESATGGNLASSGSSTSNEALSYTPSTNQTLYVKVFGWNGATNVYDITIEGPQTIGGSITATAMGNAVGAWNITGASPGTQYRTEWSLIHVGQSGPSTLQNGTDLWTASSSATSHADQVNHWSPWVGGVWCFEATLFAQDGTNWINLGTDDDCWSTSFSSTSIGNDTSGQVDVFNLSAGQSVESHWELRNQSGVAVQSGTEGITANGTGFGVGNIAWTLPSQRETHCLVSELRHTNQTVIEETSDCFYPSLPDAELTTFTNNSIGADSLNLTVNDGYRIQAVVRDSGNQAVFTSSQTSWTATNTSRPWTWAWNAPNASGNYCATVTLSDDLGSTLDSSASCINLAYDADGDGVLNEDDLCPGTPVGATVDLDGCADSQKDTDGDGCTDDVDAFRNDATQCTDSDGDGYGDNQSGVNPDAFPNDPNEWEDSDGDGVGDNGDAFPNDPNETTDSDGDGHGDNGDAFPADPNEWEDSDGDGVGDNADAFPNDESESADSDGDGVGDNADAFPNDSSETSDSDDDGVGDNSDPFPTDGTQWADADGDGYGDNLSGNNPDHCPDTPESAPVDERGCSEGQQDDDLDGVMNPSDACPNTPAGSTVDAVGCADSQKDADDDGVSDAHDQCPGTSLGSTVDGAGCAADQRDTDGDGVDDSRDACPATSPGAAVDGVGCAAEELDDDDDGVSNANDTCPNTAENDVADANGCGAQQRDSDADSVFDADDHCPSTPAGSMVDINGCSDVQRDTDGDGVSDLADRCPGTLVGAQIDNLGCAASQRDSDYDSVMDDADMCPATPAQTPVDAAGCSEAQKDSDDDGVSDADDRCENSPMGAQVNDDGCALIQLDSDQDGVNDLLDAFPNDPFETEDTDHDGVGNNADAYPRDPSRTVEESNLIPLLIGIGVLMLLAGGILGGLLYVRNQAPVQASAGPPQSKPDEGPMNWVDADGVNWARQADGSTYWFDVDQDSWVRWDE